MLRFNLILLVTILTLQGCIVVPTHIDDYSLKVINKNEQEVHMRNVLLIGTGPVASRLFLESLSSKMMHALQLNGVQSSFSFVGKVPQYGSFNMDSLVKPPFDTYLLFRASDKNSLDMSKQKYTAYGYGGITATGYGNQYQETYKVTLYQKRAQLEMVWEGDLNVDLDLAKDQWYRQISKEILDEFAKNDILPQ